MTQEVKIVFTGENKGLLEMYEKERQANQKKDEALRRASRAAKQAYNEEKELARDAAKAIERSLTPLEKLKQEREKLRKQLELGLITEKEFQRIQNQLNQEFREGKTNTAAYKEEQRKLNEEKRRAEQITRSVETAEERYERQLMELRAQLKAGRIDQETFNRSIRRHKAELAGNVQQTGLLEGAFNRLLPATLGIAAALGKAASEQAKFREETEQSVLKIDRLTRAFQIQAGLNALQARDARKDILTTARANAVDEDTAFAAATQLVSSGFASPEKSGALDAFLKIVASSNKAGEDPTALVQGAGQFLTAFGMEKNGQNLLNLGMRSRGLFAETDFQVGDLTAFAQSAGTFAGAGVSLEDTLSANAILRETMQASEAATQGRNVVSSFQTFAADAGRSKVLQEQLGLQPGQLDLVGETLPQALGTLDTAINALPQEERAAALTKLFGRENLRGAQALLAGRGKFQSFAGLQNDRAGFIAGVNTAQSGPNAAANRFAIDETLIELQKEDEASRRVLGNQLLNEQDKANYQASGIMGDIGIGISNAVRNPLLYFDMASPETFLGPQGTKRINEAQQSNFSNDQLQQALGENAQGVKELVAAVRENTQEQKRPRRSANQRPPAAALGNN